MIDRFESARVFCAHGVRQPDLDCKDSQHNCPHPDLQGKELNYGANHGSFSTVAAK